MAEALKLSPFRALNTQHNCPAAGSRSNNSARVLFAMGDNADHASLCINAGCMPSKAMFEPDRLTGAGVSQSIIEERLPIADEDADSISAQNSETHARLLGLRHVATVRARSSRKLCNSVRRRSVSSRVASAMARTRSHVFLPPPRRLRMRRTSSRLKPSPCAFLIKRSCRAAASPYTRYPAALRVGRASNPVRS